MRITDEQDRYLYKLRIPGSPGSPSRFCPWPKLGFLAVLVPGAPSPAVATTRGHLRSHFYAF